jgi:neutral ceramidase
LHPSARLGFLLLLPGLIYAQSSFRAGVARVDITPPHGHAMAGYPEHTHGAAGTHDPLYATVLLLDSGATSTAFVSCDLASFVSARVAAEARQKFGVTYTILSMSGTHSGPVTTDPRSKWFTAAEDKMVEAIGQAKSALFPAEIAVASGRAYLAFNRRKVTDGQAHMWWRNPEMEPSHPLDPTVNVVAVRDAQKVRAVLVNYAARAAVMGPGNLEFSADYPGAMRRAVEAQTPGALCLFVQGASGDISPYREREPGKVPAFDAMERMGRDLAAEVLRALARIKPLPDAAQPLRVAAENVEVANRWQPAAHIQIGIAAGTVGGGLCFLALPGEPFIEHQITFQARAECGMALLFGSSYSGGGAWAGFLPTLRAATEGGEGAGYDTTVAVGTGEMLVDRGVVDIMKLRGLLQDLPDPRF